MWLFCILDPFIPTQIKFLATPLVLTNKWILYGQLRHSRDRRGHRRPRSDLAAYLVTTPISSGVGW